MVSHEFKDEMIVATSLHIDGVATERNPKDGPQNRMMFEILRLILVLTLTSNLLSL